MTKRDHFKIQPTHLPQKRLVITFIVDSILLIRETKTLTTFVNDQNKFVESDPIATLNKNQLVTERTTRPSNIQTESQKLDLNKPLKRELAQANMKKKNSIMMLPKKRNKIASQNLAQKAEQDRLAKLAAQKPSKIA